MFGIELITTRHRQQLQAAEASLKLTFLRDTMKRLTAVVQEERDIYFESNAMPGEGLTEQEDRDHVKQLDGLLFDAKMAIFHMDGLPAESCKPS